MARLMFIAFCVFLILAGPLLYPVIKNARERGQLGERSKAVLQEYCRKNHLILTDNIDALSLREAFKQDPRFNAE